MQKMFESHCKQALLQVKNMHANLFTRSKHQAVKFTTTLCLYWGLQTIL